MVEENERPHDPPFREGQDAPYFEAAQIATTLGDHEVQHASSSSKLSRAYLAAPSTMQLFGGFGNVPIMEAGALETSPTCRDEVASALRSEESRAGKECDSTSRSGR